MCGVQIQQETIQSLTKKVYNYPNLLERSRQECKFLPCLYMKKKYFFFISSLCLCIGIVSWAISSDKKKSGDLVSENTYQSEETAIDDTEENIVTPDTESASTEGENRIILKMPCENSNDKSELEIIDCVFIPDTELASHNEYKAEFFMENEVPSVDVSREITYAFFNCKWKNGSDHTINACIDFYGFIEAEDFPYLALSEGLCYFDKSKHNSGDDRIHKFFWHTLEAGEELECTIGFAFKEPEDPAFSEKDNRTYYIGLQPVGVDYFTLENTKGYIVPLIETGDVND